VIELTAENDRLRGISHPAAPSRSLLRAPLKPGERPVCYCPPGICQAPPPFRGPCNRAIPLADASAQPRPTLPQAPQPVANQVRVDRPDGTYAADLVLPGDPPGPADVRRVVNGYVYWCEPQSGRLRPVIDRLASAQPAPLYAAPVQQASPGSDHVDSSSLSDEAVRSALRDEQLVPVDNIRTGMMVVTPDGRDVEVYGFGWAGTHCSDLKWYCSTELRVRVPAALPSPPSTADNEVAPQNEKTAQEPVAWRVKKDDWIYFDQRPNWHYENGYEIEELYAAPAAQPVPPAQPTLAVWYGKMPESNGRNNWTAILHRGQMHEGFTIARSEYPGRVRYEADCVRFLIGELAKEPSILDYDGDERTPCHLCGGSGTKDGKPCWGLNFEGTVHPGVPAQPDIARKDALLRQAREVLEHITRRLQMDIDDGGRPDQWSMEDLVRKAAPSIDAIAAELPKEPTT
jgi:hypothetical protein